MSHTKGSQRVDDRVDDCRRRTDGAGFAHTFNSKWIYRRRSLRLVEFEPRKIRGLGNRIVHQSACDELTRLIVHGLLEEGLTESLSDAAMDLTVNGEWIDNPPAVIHSHVAPELDLSSFGIHFHDGDVSAEREGVVRRLEERSGFQPRLKARGDRLRMVG